MTGLFADAMTDMVTSKVKSDSQSAVVKQIAGNDIIKKEAASKVADTVMKDGVATDTLTDSAMGKAKEKATDMAAEQVVKTVGEETLTKDTAKSVIKSVL